ncbi:MAG TPA: hypothetical protein VFK03_02990 [Candidatus Saccharimonadales bacterium]|nr:hypothetical protein [Candidatus Saccharimonadales bacterium]
MQPNQTDTDSNDYDKPVAYDTEGRPLYLHPAEAPATAQPHVIHASRPLEPPKQEISEAVVKKHEASKQAYPQLNLSEGEYVITVIKRHPIGLLSIWTTVAILILAACVLAPILLWHQGIMQQAGLLGVGVIFALAILFLIGGYVSTYVYNANQLFLTNESIFQQIRLSLFAQRNQSVSLGSVEDVSFFKKGIIEYMFDYGKIRLSTVGEENTYRLSYVGRPATQVKLLNDAVEAYKNGRPVDNR